jgi:DNA-binding protein HU-beta
LTTALFGPKPRLSNPVSAARVVCEASPSQRSARRCSRREVDEAHLMTSTGRYAKQVFPRFLRNLEMNSSELVTIVAEAHDISKAQAQAILDSVLKSIVSAAASDDEVSLAGFGKFKVKASPKREGRNPANGEKITIAESKKLSFSPAKAVKGALNA